jgi:hypothetical protein
MAREALVSCRLSVEKIECPIQGLHLELSAIL